MKILFIGSIVLVFFAYFGYPGSLWLLGIFWKKTVKKAPFFPDVTIIITAYNEEKRIKDKLDNTLVLEYSTEKLQILV